MLLGERESGAHSYHRFRAFIKCEGGRPCSPVSEGMGEMCERTFKPTVVVRLAERVACHSCQLAKRRGVATRPYYTANVPFINKDAASICGFKTVLNTRPVLVPVYECVLLCECNRPLLYADGGIFINRRPITLKPSAVPLLSFHRAIHLPCRKRCMKIGVRVYQLSENVRGCQPLIPPHRTALGHSYCWKENPMNADCETSVTF